jgi:O-antigen ligase
VTAASVFAEPAARLWSDARFTRKQAGFIAAFGALAGLFLAIQSGNVAMLVVAIAGLFVLAAACRSPEVALLLVVIVQVSSMSDVVANLGLPSSPYLITLFIATAWAVYALFQNRSLIGSSPMYLLIVVVLLAQAISMLGTAGSGLNLSPLQEALKDTVFFFTVVVLCRATGRTLSVVRVAVGVLGALAALTVFQEYVLHNSTTLWGLANMPLTADIGGATSRHAGPEIDANFWGRTLVLFLPLSLTLAALALARAKMFWFAVAGAFIAGIYLTGSRGALLSIGVAIAIWLLAAGRKYLSYVAPMIAIVVLAFMLLPGAFSRIATIAQLTDDAPTSQVDQSIVDRIAVQQIAVAIFADHPVTGVGVGNFTEVEPRYLSHATIGTPSRVFAPHNLYLELAAEQGLVGLAAWALFLGGSGFLCLRVAALAGHNRSERLLGAGLLAGLCAWGAASVFLHLVGYRNLLLIVALITVVDLQTRERHIDLVTGDGIEGPRRRRQAMSGGRLTVLAIAGVTIIVASAALLQNTPLFEGKTRYAAEVSLQVRPARAGAEYANAYRWDTVNRALLLPTYAGIIGSQRFRDEAERDLRLTGSKTMDDTTLNVIGDPANGIIRVSSESSSRAIPTALINRVITDATGYLSTASPTYVLREVSRTDASPVRERNFALLGLVGILLFAIAALVVVNIKRMSEPVSPTRRTRVSSHKRL